MSIIWKLRCDIKMKYILYIHTCRTITQKYAQWSQVNIQKQKPMDTLQSVQHHKKVEHFFLLCQVLAEKHSSHISTSGRMFCREVRMVLAEGRLLFSCLGVVGDIRYSNDLGLMKRHGKRLYFLQRQPRTFLQNIAAILKTNHIG